MTGIIDDLRAQQCKSVVRARFGNEAARIFQILLEKRLLEEKQVRFGARFVLICLFFIQFDCARGCGCDYQIQEMALIQKRTTRECLHRMLAADVVRLQEVRFAIPLPFACLSVQGRLTPDLLVSNCRFRKEVVVLPIACRLALATFLACPRMSFI